MSKPKPGIGSTIYTRESGRWVDFADRASEYRYVTSMPQPPVAMRQVGLRCRHCEREGVFEFPEMILDQRGLKGIVMHCGHCGEEREHGFVGRPKPGLEAGCITLDVTRIAR